MNPLEQGIIPVKNTVFEQVDGVGHNISGQSLSFEELENAVVLEESALDAWNEMNITEQLTDQHLVFNFYIHPSESIHYCWTQSNGSVYYASHQSNGDISIIHVETTSPYAENETPVQCAVSLTDTDLPRIIYADGGDVKIARYARGGSQFQLYWNLTDVWHTRTIVEQAFPTHFEMVLTELNTMWAVMRDQNGTLHQVNFSSAYWTTSALDQGPIGQEIELMFDDEGMFHILYTRTDLNEIRLLRIDEDASESQVVKRDASITEFLGMGLDSNNIEQLATSTSSASGYQIQLLRSLLGQRQGRISPDSVDMLNVDDDGLKSQVAFADLNGDGFDDAIFAAPSNLVSSMPSTGSVFVYYGSIDGYAENPNVTINGDLTNQNFGSSLLSEDLNGDGYDDVIISSTLGSGLVEIYYGSSLGIGLNANMSINGTDGENFGSDMTILRTTSQDLYLAVSSTHAETSINADLTVNGKVSIYLIEETEISKQRDLIQTANGPAYGSTLTACDINGDGYDDLLVGNSPNFTDRSGYSSLEYFSGDEQGFDGSPDHVLSSFQQGRLFAYDVACLGDINNDGKEDHMLSEPLNGSTGVYEGGKLWLFLGNDEFSATPNWTYSSSVPSAKIGRQIIPLPDIDDDGNDDLLISQYSSGASGRVEIFFGDGQGYETQSELLFQGESNDEIGFIVAAGFDMDRDGMQEIAVAKLVDDGSGGQQTELLIHSKREWESISFDYDGDLQSLELGTSARGETTIVHLAEKDGFSSLHQLEHVDDGTNSGQWLAQELRTGISTHSNVGFDVTSAGRPMITLSVNQTSIDLISNTGATGLHKEILTAGTMGQHIGATIGADDQHHLSFTSGSGNQIFYTFEDEGAWSSEMVRSSMVLNEGIQIHATLDSKPYLVYRDTTALDIEIAVKNNSAWEFDSVSPDISVSGEHFSSPLLSNGTLVIAGLIHDGQTTNLTIWDWNHSITSNTTLAVIEDNQTQLSMGVSSDGTVYLATLTSGGALSLHSRNATESTWNTHALAQPPTSNGGYNLDMDVSTNLALSIGTTSTIELRTSDDGQNWTNSFHSFSTHIDAAWDLVVTDDHYIMITTHSTSGNLVWNSIHREHITSQHSTWSSMEFGLIETPSTTSAILDLNNTLHLGIWDDVNDDVEVIRIYQDTDRDHVFDAIDEFPALGNQWLDSDGDGYGDNQFGPIADGCPSEAGTSSFVIFGCIF